MKYILQDIPYGKNIRKIRMEKNMTQMDVTIKMQIMGSSMTRGTLANIESGNRNIKASDLRYLKYLLSVEYDELLEGEKEGDKNCEI